MAFYELVAVARSPQPAAPPTLAEVGPLAFHSVSWADELNADGDLTTTITPSTVPDDIALRLRDLATYPTELWLYRDSDLVWAGPIVGGSMHNDGLQLVARGLGYYLRYMLVGPDTGDLVFAQVDQHYIARDLVDAWQQLDHGNYGVDTSGVTASGVLRDRTYVAAEPRGVYDLVRELAAVDGGFDWRVHPSTRQLEAHYPRRGTDRSQAVFLDARNVTSGDVAFSVAADDVASDAYGIGTGGDTAPLTAAQSDTSVRSTFGRAGIARTFDGVVVQATLDAHARALLAARTRTLFIPGPELIGVANAGVEDFAPGDDVSFSFDPGIGRIDGVWRVAARTVQVDESGDETMAVEFA